jgi:hypothetical protein
MTDVAVKRRKKAEHEPNPRVEKRAPKTERVARTQRPVRRVQDPTGKIAEAMMEFCNDLGFRIVEVWTHWSELSLCREYELRVPQEAAEEAAWRDIKACLDKRDTEQWEVS